MGLSEVSRKVLFSQLIVCYNIVGFNLVLKYLFDILQSQLFLKQSNDQLILPEESKLLQDKRNLVNIKTAKVHEYEASLLEQLDSIADQFFVKPKHIWAEQKKILNQKVMQIFNDM